MNSLAQRRQTATKALDDYTSGSGAYAFGTYDARPANDSHQLLPEDILAANLLSLRLSASDVVPLFAEGDGAPQDLLAAMNSARVDLCEVKPFESYSDFGDLEQAIEPLVEANTAARNVSFWTSVTVSKVLHRHVPHAVPIIDSRVRKFYGVRKNQDRELYRRLWADIRANQSWLTELGKKYLTPDGRALSVLRVADILIWMPSPDPTAPTVSDLAPDVWDQKGLEARGWEGFVPLMTHTSADVPGVPGVYAILRDDGSDPVFLADRPRASARQANTYSVSDLASRWVAGASVLNIGRGGTSVKTRLRQYRQFGMGVGLNHKGGRSIWQLADGDRLMVAWRQFPVTYDGLTTREAESGLIAAFQEAHAGMKPFANRVK